MNRRDFLSSLAIASAAPPLPPGWKPALHSPKYAEHLASLRKVPRVHVAIAPRSARLAAQPGGVTGLSIAVSGGQATISWQAGVPPFGVEQQIPGGAWTRIGNLTMARTVTVPVVGAQAFFRIHESVPMPLSVVVQPDGAHLTWVPPDL